MNTAGLHQHLPNRRTINGYLYICVRTATCGLSKKAEFTNKEMLSIIHFILINKKVKEQRLNVLVFSSPNIILSPLSVVTSLVYIL